MEIRFRELPDHSLPQRRQGRTVPVDGKDLALRTDQVTESEGECAPTGAEIGPGSTLVVDSWCDQADMVVMIHISSIAPSVAGRPRSFRQWELPVRAG